MQISLKMIIRKSVQPQLQAHVQSSSDAPAQALYKIISQLAPDTQVQVLGLIGDRKDLSAVNYVNEMLNSQNAQVRLASIDAMSKLGDFASASTLFNIAVNGSGDEKTAAHLGLVGMTGTNVVVLVNANAMSGTIPMRVEAIKLIGERHMTDSTGNLLTIATEDNEDTSSAAFKSLGEVADTSSIPTIVDLITKAKSDEARKSGVTTLKSILSKAKNKDAAAQVVIDQINKADEQVKVSLISSLSSLGGSKALVTVVETTKSSDQTLKDTAIRTLCDWPDFEATGNLLTIASNPETSLAHHVLAIRGILRLIDQSYSVSLDDRAILCLSTYDIARRNEEKGQVIATMGTLPASKIADKLLEIAQGDTLKNEAALAAVQMAGSMARTDGQASQALAQKVLEMNISSDINTQAQAVISGRGGRGGFGGNNRMGQRGARNPVVRPDRAKRIAAVKELETQIAALKEAIEKAPEKDPNFAALDNNARTQAIAAMQPENDAINAIQATLESLRDSNAGAGAGRGGMNMMGGMPGFNTSSDDALSELRVLANNEKATKTVERIDVLIKEALAPANTRRGGMMGGATRGGGNRRNTTGGQ